LPEFRKPFCKPEKTYYIKPKKEGTELNPYPTNVENRVSS